MYQYEKILWRSWYYPNLQTYKASRIERLLSGVTAEKDDMSKFWAYSSGVIVQKQDTPLNVYKN